MSPAKKSKVTCYHCRSSYMLDLAKVPAGTQAFKCVKCGNEVPILARVLPGEAKAPAVAAAAPAAAGAAQASRAGREPEELDLDRPQADPYPAEEGESWLAVYGDMMSLLLVFFVLMFAISTIDKHKFETVVEAVSQALGGNVRFEREPAPAPSVPSLPPDPLAELRSKARQEADAMSGIQARLQALVEQDNMQRNLAVKNEPKGVVLILQDMAMFDLGSAEIKPEIRPLLVRIGALLKGMPNEIVVEGHTDNLPISTARFASNWELSVMRATNVVHFLLEQARLEPARVAAAGYAYFRPRHDFGSPDNSKNRRIEIVVQRRYDAEMLKDLSLQPPPAPAGRAR
ncbi:MAG: flagellar motor protein MotB [Thermodesulfobacteriota bacterium]